jgi:hypothetical protein
MRNLTVGLNDGKRIKIPSKMRYRHILLIGASGTGKTSLIHNMLHQDSFHGNHAMIFVDPSGIESEKALGVIDPTRIIRYCSLETPISLNPLVRPFRNYMVYETLVNIIDQAVQASTGQVKLTVGMRKSLKAALFQELEMKYPSLENVFKRIEEWHNRAKVKTEDMQSAMRLATRLNDLLSDAEDKRYGTNFREIICGGDSLDWDNFLENGHLLILNCHGMSRSQMLLLGNIVVQSLVSYYMNIKKEDYPPCALFIDELDNFVNEHLLYCMKYSRKYNLSVLLSHQDHTMIYTQFGKQLLNSILANAGTILAFRVGFQEATILAKIFTEFSFIDIKDNEDYQLYARIGKDEYELKSLRPPYIDKEQIRQIIQRQTPKKKVKVRFEWVK